MNPLGRCNREFEMKSRVTLTSVGPEGTVVGSPGALAEYVPRMFRLTLADGKRVLAGSRVPSRRSGACL